MLPNVAGGVCRDVCVLCATLTGGINPSFRAIASTAMSGGSIVMCQSELLCGV